MLLLERPLAPDPEALIEEARTRQRRRRRGTAVVALLVAGVGVAAYLVWGRSGSPAVERVPNGPVVNLGAFAGHGRLAFVSKTTLWVLDGRTLRHMPLPAGYFVPQNPQLSADGKWLAYLAVSPNGVTPSQLWLAHGDGSDAHVVRMPQPEQLVGWSGDTVALVAGPEHVHGPCPCYSSTTIRLVSPPGSVRTLVRAKWIYGAAWSPDGKAIAFGDDAMLTNRIATIAVSGGKPVIWRTTRTTVLHVAGWWRGGIGYWPYCCGSIHNNDGNALDLVDSPGARPRLVGKTLSDGSTDEIAASTTGDVALVTGPLRDAWLQKRLVVCAATCKPLVAGGGITLDPSWSPDGRTLLFSTAPNVLDGPYSQRRVEAWFAQHRTRLYDTATGRIRDLPTAKGATAVTWSRDGRSLLFVKDDALWLLPTLTGKAVEVASPLYPMGRWPQYYAQVSWATQFSWASS